MEINEKIAKTSRVLDSEKLKAKPLRMSDKQWEKIRLSKEGTQRSQQAQIRHLTDLGLVSFYKQKSAVDEMKDD